MKKIKKINISKAPTQRIDSVSEDDVNTDMESMQGIIDEGSDHWTTESETVETTATYESFDDEPSIQYNDLSTQTDFSPTISLESFDELNTIRLDCPSQARLTILEQKKNLKKRAIIEDLEIRKRWFQVFQLQAKKKKNLIGLKNEDDTHEVIPSDESNNSSEMDDRKLPTMGIIIPSSFSDSSSQTEISTLLIGLDFEDRLPSEDVQSQIRKLNGHLVTMNENLFKLKSETNRFRQYCDDLNAGKTVTVYASDLSSELHAEIKLGKLISQMNDTKIQIKQHVNVFKEKYPSLIVRFEEDIDFVESHVLFVSSHIPFVEAYEQMQTISIKLESIERNFANSLRSSVQRKITISQLQKLISKIPNQKAEIFKKSFKKLKNEFKADFDYAESIQLPKIAGAMSQSDIEISYENAKLIHGRLKLILSKLNDRLCERIKRYAKKTKLSTDDAGSTIGFQSERSSLLQNQPIIIKDSKPLSYDDLSTQTDFTPTITLRTFKKYELISRSCTDPKSHLSELKRIFESTKQNNKTNFKITQKKIDCQFEDFQKKALQNKTKIKFEIDEFSNFCWLIKNYRKNNFFLNRAQIQIAVASQFTDSSDGVFLIICKKLSAKNK